MTPLLKGGQGRTAHDIGNAAFGFTFAAVLFIVVLALVYAFQPDVPAGK